MANKSMGTLTLWLRGDATQLMATMATVEKTMLASAAKMRSIGISMSMYLTAPLALVGGAVTKSIMGFDDAMNKSVAIMGQQGIEMRGEMEKTAIAISKTTSTSATEMAEAYFFLASAGLTAKQSIEALAVVEKFAVAGSFDLQKATTLAMDSQAALGMKSKDATINMMNLKKVTDILVGANTLANASTEQFAIALTHGAGAAMKNFKIGLEDGIAILAAYADQGIKAERAGNMFSRMIRLQTAGVIRNRAQWKQFGVDIYDANNNLRPLTDMVKDLSGAFEGMSGKMIATKLHLLGFKARSQQAIFPLLGMTEKTREFMDALEDMNGMTEQVAAYRLTSFTNQWKIAKNHMVAAGLSFKSAITPYLEKVNKMLTKTGEAFEKLSKAQKDSIVKWTLIIAAIGPVLVLLSFFIKLAAEALLTLKLIGLALFNVVKGLWLLAKGLKVVAVALLGLSSTVWIVIAVVVAFLAIAYVIRAVWVQNVLFIQEAWGKLLDAMKIGLEWLTDNFKSAWSFLWDNVKAGLDWFLEVWNIALQGFLDAWQAGLEWLSNTAIGGFLKWLVKEWASAFKNLGKNAVEFFKGVIAHDRAAKAYLTNMWKGPTAAQEAWAAALVDTYDTLDGAFGKFKDGIIAGYKVMGATVKKVVGTTEYVFSEVWDAVKVQFSEDLEWMMEKLKEMVPGMAEQLEEAMSTIHDAMAEAGDELEPPDMSKWDKFWDDYWAGPGQKLKDYFAESQDVISNFTDVAISSLRGLGDSITEIITGGEVDWREFARNILKQLINIMVQALLVYAILSLIPGMGAIMAANAAAAPAINAASAGVTVGQAASTASNYQPTMADATGPRQYHTGGIIGQGALKPDERVVVAETGEVMLSREDVRGARDSSSEEKKPSYTIVNVLDRKEMLAALSTVEGERTILNVMRRNRGSVNSMIG